MGERHMVYVRVDDTGFGQLVNEVIYYNNNVMGLHHQWLLGYDACNCLVNMIDMHQKNVHFDEQTEEHGAFNLSPFQLYAADPMYRRDISKVYTHAEKVMQALYNSCPITGFWSNSAKILDKEKLFWNDNNTGMTIIDFLECETPKYCFINPGSMFVDGNMDELESGVPLDAETYLTAFGDPPERWPEGRFEYILEKLSSIQLLTKAELYDIFLLKQRLDVATDLKPMPDFLEG